MCNCSVCKRIEMIKKDENPHFVKELDTGYVVLGDFQRFRGYTIFICKECAPELHFLESGFRIMFLQDMALVAEAVFNAFRPDKLNYELLGVGNAVHMHWHFFPRFVGDTPEPGPVWRLPASELYSEAFRPSEQRLNTLKNSLRIELEKLMG